MQKRYSIFHLWGVIISVVANVGCAKGGGDDGFGLADEGATNDAAAIILESPPPVPSFADDDDDAEATDASGCTIPPDAAGRQVATGVIVPAEPGDAPCEASSEAGDAAALLVAMPPVSSGEGGSDAAPVFSHGLDAAVAVAVNREAGLDDASDDAFDAALEAIDVYSGAEDGGPAPAFASTVSPGDLIITEVMFDPSGFTPQSQWFEVYNATGQPALLNGLTIRDGAMNSLTVESDSAVIVPPTTYALLVRDIPTALDESLSPASILYEYGAGLDADAGIVFDHGPNGALSLWNQDVEIANVPYGPWGMASLGQSIELVAPQYLGSDSPQAWCLASSPWAADSDDGTPGAPNDCP